MRVEAKRSGSHVLMTVVGILTHWQSPGSVGALRSGVTCLLPEDGGDFHPLIIIGYTGGGGNERLNFGWGEGAMNYLLDIFSHGAGRSIMSPRGG